MGPGCPELNLPVASSKNLVILPLHEKMKKHLIILSIALFSLPAFSQTMEVGLFGGASYYLGDLNPGKHFWQTDLAYGGLARYNVNPRWAVKLNVFTGHVRGDDAVSNTNPQRDLRFRSRVTEVSAVGEFNFFEYFTGSKRDVLTPYIYGGVGAFFFNPEAGGVKLRSIGTEGQQAGFDGRSPYRIWAICIPFGLGAKLSLSSRFAVAAEWGLRKTFTDYLDDVSRTYYLDGSQIDPNDPTEYLSDPTQLHQPLMERGNPETRDWYSFTGVTVTYKFRLFGRKGCPDQIRNDIK